MVDVSGDGVRWIMKAQLRKHLLQLLMSSKTGGGNPPIAATVDYNIRIGLLDLSSIYLSILHLCLGIYIALFCERGLQNLCFPNP